MITVRRKQRKSLTRSRVPIAKTTSKKRGTRSSRKGHHDEEKEVIKKGNEFSFEKDSCTNSVKTIVSSSPEATAETRRSSGGFISTLLDWWHGSKPKTVVAPQK